MSFYAVANGKQTGIFNTWAECKANTDGFKGARFKKFNTKEEAEKFISEYSCTPKQIIPALQETEFVPDYYVYTDGSCSNNGRLGAVAGIGIYFGENDVRNVSERIAGKQTNNTAELGAILHVYRIIEGDILAGKNIGVVSDSEYAIRCVTSYGKRCEIEGWKKDMPNKELVKKVYELYRDKPNVRFTHVMAHTGFTDAHSIGNDGADRLANAAVGFLG